MNQDEPIEPLTAEQRLNLERWANTTLQRLGLTKEAVRKLSLPYLPFSRRALEAELDNAAFDKTPHYR